MKKIGAPVDCPRCGRPNPSGLTSANRCMWCGDFGLDKIKIDFKPKMKLKNCRWCKSMDLHIEEFYVGCLSCGAIGPSAESKEQAIKAWNTRAGEWISVKDRLPNPNGDWVLVYADEAVNCMGFDKKNGFSDWNFSPCNGVDISRITHWMPLPAPPEEE